MPMSVAVFTSKNVCVLQALSFFEDNQVNDDIPILSCPLPILTITLSDLNFSKSSLCNDMLCHNKAPIASLSTLSCISEVVLI